MKITKMIMGVLLITMGMGAQPLRVRDGSGKTTYIENELKTFVHENSGTSYTVGIFADSVSPTKNHFVLYTKANVQLEHLHYVFGVNNIGYSLYGSFPMDNNRVFYTELADETVALFCSDKFEGICVSSNEFCSQTLTYGAYFKQFIQKVKARKY